MSLLYRFAKLPDRHNSHLFTFIVTKSVTRDLYRDVTSKEFVFGYQKWAITFSRTEKGVYLVWRNPSEGMKVYVDFSFTLLNREHFSANETFSGKNVKFTYGSPAQGNRRYIAVQDLYSRNFADRNGEFQLELTMGGIRTVFETDLRTPLNSFISSSRPTSSSSVRLNNIIKSESTYFNFGGFDWNVAIYPFGKDPSTDDRLFVYLNRLTGFDHQCRVRYVMTLGEGDRIINSGLLDDISDSNGKSYGWSPRIRINDIIQRGLIHVHLEILTANTLSEVALVPHAPTVNGGAVVTTEPTESLAVQCYDRDKQGWTLEADTVSETLRLRIIHKDVHNICRNHLRHVCWSAYLLRYNNKTGLLDPITCTHAPYSHYYAQEEIDEGIMMETDVTVKEIRDPNSFYLNDKQQVRVQIEWLSSYLLFQSTYHKYDDVTRIHNYQMRKEIAALQSENYSLERQLFSYQKSLAYAHQHTATTTSAATATATASSTNRIITGGGETAAAEDDDEPYEEDLPHHHHNHHHHHNIRPFLLDRSVSTETDYA